MLRIKVNQSLKVKDNLGLKLPYLLCQSQDKNQIDFFKNDISFESTRNSLNISKGRSGLFPVKNKRSVN